MIWQEHADCPKEGTLLCALSDVPDGGAYEVTFGKGKENFKILLLRKGQDVWSYLNICPHFSLTLNFHPQKFLVSEGQLVCAHHTAFFDFETGDCTDGPCTGNSLTKIPSCMMDGLIYFGDEGAVLKSQASD